MSCILVGGSINLALKCVASPPSERLISLTSANSASNSKSGSVSLKTYLVFVTLMCLGFPIAFLLSHPTQVRRSDGSPVGYSKHKHSIAAEFKLLGQAITHKRV